MIGTTSKVSQTDKKKNCSVGDRIGKGILGGWAALDGAAAFGMGVALDGIAVTSVSAGCGQAAALATCGPAVVYAADMAAGSIPAFWAAYEVYRREVISDLGEALGQCKP